MKQFTNSNLRTLNTKNEKGWGTQKKKKTAKTLLCSKINAKHQNPKKFKIQQILPVSIEEM